MKPLNETTFMVCDCGGLNSELACLLGRKAKKVYYHVPNDDAYTTHNRSIIGKGYAEIELADKINFEKFDEVDKFVFPDVGLGPDAWHLRYEDKKQVWSSMYGEELEMDRIATKELMKSLGIPVGPYEVIKGSDDLLKFLKDYKNGFVKTSWFRGEFESRRWKDWINSHKWIEKILFQLGTEGADYTFIVEDMLPKDPEQAGEWVEVGEDMYVVDGKFPSRHLMGIEVKDCGYAGCFKDRSEFPKIITEISDKLAPKLLEVGYRGEYSTERRIGPELIAYPIDETCRRPSPPGEAMMSFYSNTAEIIAAGAEGELVDPEPIDDARFVMQIVMKSEGHDHHDEQTITFPEEFRDNVKLHCSRRIGKNEFEIVPQAFELAEVGSVAGWGKTLKEAHEMCEEVSKSISGTYVTCDTDVLDQVEKEIEKAVNMGLEIT